MTEYDQSRAYKAREDADAAWVAGQLAKRHCYYEERVKPLLLEAGRSVDDEKAASWIANMARRP